MGRALTTQKNITLLEDLLIHDSLILRCQLVGSNNPRDLVDRTRQSSTCDKLAQILIYETLADIE